MQVVILCGGVGTRLREETEFRPKPMVNIGSRPILWHIMKIYAHYNVSEFVLALGHKSEMIKDYFIHYEIINNDVTIELGSPKSLHIHNCHDESGWKITMANTGDKAMKGARLKKIEKYINGRSFMLTYGDGVSDIDIRALLKFHEQHGKIATVTGINPAERFGELKTNGDKVLAFSEKPKVSKRGYINGGFFVFNREIFDYLNTDDECDLEYGVLGKLAAEGELQVYKHHGFWACMDTIRDMEYLNNLWAINKAQWKLWD